MSSLKERLQEILIREKLISEKNFQAALAEQKETGESLSKILVKNKFVQEEDLTMALSEGLGMPPIDISRLKVDPEVLKLIPQNLAVNYKVMPISKMGNNLTLAMADPLNIFAVDNLKALTGLTITPIIAQPRAIMEAISTYYTKDTSEYLEEIM